MYKTSGAKLAQKLNKLSTFILIVLFLSSASNKPQKQQLKSIWAGTKDKTPETQYNKMGLPTNRLWLTSKEWRGKHIKNHIVKSRFKAWKKIHIKQFIKFFGAEAKKESKVYPAIPPALYVAQCILESNFALSRLAVTGNNLYGHKYRGQKDGFLVAHDDSPTDKFTKFKSQWYSLRSHSKLLMNRYHKRIKGTPTLEKWLGALCGGNTPAQSRKWRAKGGKVYATSCLCGEGYGQKLKRIIKYYNLENL